MFVDGPSVASPRVEGWTVNAQVEHRRENAEVVFLAVIPPPNVPVVHLLLRYILEAKNSKVKVKYVKMPKSWLRPIYIYFKYGTDNNVPIPGQLPYACCNWHCRFSC